MTLSQLSEDYHRNSQILSERVKKLERQIKDTKNHQERSQLGERVRILSTMLRESQEIAVLTARYYDRGYRKNVKYTL
ncbi:MAG: hypothetical protein R3Y07_03940 [Eubacteriales bacterium]